MDLAIRPADVARALNVSPRTVRLYIEEGLLAGEQDITKRRRVRVSEIFRLARERDLTGTRYEGEVRERLVRDILPKYEKQR